MKNLKKIFAIGLSLGLAAAISVSASASSITLGFDVDAIKGNKYVTSMEIYKKGSLVQTLTVTNDENHRAVSGVITAVDTGEVVSKIEITRDAAGRTIEEKEIAVEGSQELVTNKKTYEYDANGKVAREAEYCLNDDETALYKENETGYLYNANGDVTNETVTSFEEGGAVYYTWSEETVYDSSNRIIEVINSLDGVNTDKRTYSYSANGKLDAILAETYDGSQYNENAAYYYYYSEDGLVVTQAYSQYVTDHYEERSKVIYTYDANGWEISEEHQEYSGGAYANISKYVTTYDEFGNILTYERLSWKNSEYVSNKKSVVNYGYYEAPVAAATSPKTADTTPIAIALTGVIALGALVISKKKA